MAHKDFTLLRINEIPFKMNLDIADLNDDKKKRIGISFLFIFQYQEGNEASAMHAVVRISLDDSIILEGGATFIFKSKIWDEMSHDEESVKKSAFAESVIEYALPFVNGVMCTRVRDTKLNGLFLPIIDASELVANIKIQEISKQEA